MRPAVKILLDAIEERGLSICTDGGKAVLLGNRKEVTPELLAALKHFRGEILEARGIKEVEEEKPKEEPKEEMKIQGPIIPPNAIIVTMDKDAYIDKAMRGPATMWTFEGAETWWYVKDHPIPKRGQK